MDTATPELRQKIFQFTDSNQDGKVSLQELRAMKEKLGVFKDEASVVEDMTKIDKNGDTFIELQELYEHVFEKPPTTDGTSGTSTGSTTNTDGTSTDGSGSTAGSGSTSTGMTAGTTTGSTSPTDATNTGTSGSTSTTDGSATGS